MQMDRLFHPFAEFEVVIAKSPLFCIQLCANTIAELPLLSTSVVVFTSFPRTFCTVNPLVILLWSVPFRRQRKRDFAKYCNRCFC